MTGRRGAYRIALLVAVGLGLPLFAGETATAVPAPTAAVSGPPNSVAVLGDSISAGTGTAGLPSAEQPGNSWATGTNSTVLSIYQRLVAINPAANGNNYNQASNGKRMEDANEQAAAMPTNTQLVLIQMGGNDLCRDTPEQMPSVAQYRARFVEALDAIAARSPNARISVSSVPDIYNLWDLRGAPNPPNSQPSSRAGTARLFWDTLAVIPCKSMVDNPTDMSAAAVLRRDTVRLRNIDYNAALAAECALRLRCRFDGGATFNFSSNRLNPPYGDLKPREEWGFVDDDISTIDHFHPSTSGQRKLAEASWAAGYNYADTQAPAVSSATVSPAPLPGGTNPTAPTVDVNYSDAAGVKGLEYRVRTEASAGAWTSSMASSVSVPVNTQGLRYVETRAVDLNGNLSASTLTAVNYDESIVPVPEITSAPSGPVTSSAGFSFSGVAGLTFECSVDNGTFTACTSPETVSGLGDGSHSFKVRQVGGSGVRSAATEATWIVDASAPEPPSISGAPAIPVKAGVPVSISFSGEVGATFECSLDGGTFTTCTSPRNASGLPHGIHSLAVRQIDSAGQTGGAGTVSWAVDTVAPAVPVMSNLPPARTNQTAPQITFAGEHLATFECSLDSPTFAPCTSPRLLSAGATGSHTFKVRQTDQAGNAGPEVSHSWFVDTTDPATPGLSGSPPAKSKSITATFIFGGEPQATFECSLDSAAYSPCASAKTITGLAEGDHSMSIRQTDQAGNTSPARVHNWVVDLTWPTAPQITSSPPAATGSTSASFVFTGEPGASFACSTDGGSFNACSSPEALSGLTEGPHTFSVRQTDVAGNTSPSGTVEWTVDTEVPAPVVNSKPASLTNSSSASITFSGGPGTTFRCSIDNQSGTCTSPLVLSSLADGNHEVLIRQIDASGNESPEASIRWTVDTTAPPKPSVPASSLLWDSRPQQTVSFSGESGGTFECRIDTAAWSSCISPAAAVFPEGSHTFEVRQTDLAGNTGPGGKVGFGIDSAAPAAPVMSGAPSGLVRSTSAAITLAGEPAPTSGERAPSETSCRLAGRAWSPCGAVWNLTGLSQGPLKVEAKQVDAAGNESPVATAEWTVDTIAPKLKGKVKVRKKGGKWLVRSSYRTDQEKPAKLEFTSARKKPSQSARSVPGRLVSWAPKLKLKSAKKVSWVRVSDAAGNQAPWVRVS